MGPGSRPARQRRLLTRLHDLAAQFARGLLFVSRPRENRGRREDRMRAAPAVSCASRTTKCAHEHTGPEENTRPSLRNGFTAYIALVLVRRALLPPSPAKGFPVANLTPA